MTLRPITLKEANEFVKANHRHNGPTVGWKFGVGLELESELVGVCMAGRPVARRLDDGKTLEVTRVCTIGHKNANSMLYGAIRRAARALGYTRLLTYTLKEEPGTSLKAAGWTPVSESPGKSWSVPSRPRQDKHTLGERIRWEASL